MFDPKLSLLESYSVIMEQNREAAGWAVHKKYDQKELVKCPIPFIGKHYFEQTVKVLVYASAEVLSDYYPGSPGERPWLDNDGIAADRHRWFFDQPEKQIGRYFPHIHIQPMNDGGLMTAVGYILSKIGLLEKDATPYTVYENLCVGNYGKYSLETEYQRKIRTGEGTGISKRNVDTAEKPDKLFASREYVRADFQILQPDYVILPSSVYKTEQSFIDQIKGNAAIIPVYQMNCGNINRLIHRKFAAYDKEKLHPAVLDWYSNLQENGLSGKTKENYLSVFTYLDSVLDEEKKGE